MSSTALTNKHTGKATEGTRLGWVDYARGLAILLVIFRHTMVGLRRSGIMVSDNLYYIQEFLLNVRMPVFFILSGVFLGRTLQKRSLRSIAANKTANLLYPYLVWSVILITFQIVLSNYTNSQRSWTDYKYILYQPRELDHMWYLLALFNTTMLFLVCYNALKRQPLLHFILAVVLYYFHYLVYDYSLVSDIMYNYVFLVFGVYMYERIARMENLDLKKLGLLFIITVPVFIAGQLFWLNHINDHYQPLRTIYLLPFLAIIFVASLVYYLVSRILYELQVAKFLAWIGKYSLYIYIVHVFVIAMVRVGFVKFLHIENQYVLILSSLVLGIIIPVLFHKLLVKLNIKYLFSFNKSGK
ncbi:acyltransferase family protein [Terrimonas rubra]|uniref:Acyltransferase family protein n=1 Tax=Terrimonas rubra TaxID=1035890 RepID=A0ABW6A6Z5_9BACT